MQPLSFAGVELLSAAATSVLARLSLTENERQHGRRKTRNTMAEITQQLRNNAASVIRVSRLIAANIRVTATDGGNRNVSK